MICIFKAKIDQVNHANPINQSSDNNQGFQDNPINQGSDNDSDKMTTQPEQILENNLVAQLVSLGYQRIVIKDEHDLLTNLKSQLEKHNKNTLTDQEFRQVLNYLNKGNTFERAKTLRDRVPYQNEQGETKTIELLNLIHWCQNEFR